MAMGEPTGVRVRTGLLAAGCSILIAVITYTVTITSAFGDVRERVRVLEYRAEEYQRSTTVEHLDLHSRIESNRALIERLRDQLSELQRQVDRDGPTPTFPRGRRFDK